MIHNFSRASEPNLRDYHPQEIIASWFQIAYQHAMAVALWRLPGGSETYLVVDINGGSQPGKVDLEETHGGFMVAPFDNNGRMNERFFKANICYQSNRGEVEINPEISSHEADSIMQQFKEALVKPKGIPPFHLVACKTATTAEKKYLEMVENALTSIRRGEMQKVVPAVARRIDLSADFNCLKTFDHLCESYPNAFVSLVSAPGIGTWMGASPEAIIEVDKHKVFSTVAVAGTQERNDQLSLQQVAWTQKEIEEQALVSRYIINCFKKIRLREFEELGPKTIIAGNLLHLKTTFTVDMEETNFPLLGSVMLDLLHPTSAVCGMPKDPAQDFIKTHEDFSRDLFSGYLGPVNIKDETHLFVNLRCMQIQPKQAILYAGAGVTEDSILDKEWMEIQLKCDTLLDVLKK